MTIEEKTIGTEEKTEEKIDREDAIQNYIDHIRNMSEITDEEMESVLDDIIEEDEELLDILEKLSSKIEKLSDKIIVILAEKEDEVKEKEEDEDKERDERREEIDNIIDAFDDADYAYPVEEIIESLRDSGYADPGKVIVDAISEGILCVDSIDEDEIMYFALTKEGESLWELRN